MRRAPLALALALAALAPRSASATTDGPTVVEVLGHDVRDKKIYYVVHRHDSSDEPSSVFFMRTSGAKAGVPVRVRSIEAGLDGDLERYEARLARLRKRLARLRPLPGMIESRSEYIHDRRSRAVARALQMRRTRRPDVKVASMELDPQTCPAVRLELSRGQLRGSIELVECADRAGVAAAYPIPDADALFVIATSRPDQIEYGYARERALMLLP